MNLPSIDPAIADLSLECISHRVLPIRYSIPPRPTTPLIRLLSLHISPFIPLYAIRNLETQGNNKNKRFTHQEYNKKEKEKTWETRADIRSRGKRRKGGRRNGTDRENTSGKDEPGAIPCKLITPQDAAHYFFHFRRVSLKSDLIW